MADSPRPNVMICVQGIATIASVINLGQQHPVIISKGGCQEYKLSNGTLEILIE